ncbi:NAD(P)H-dependent flavin oxidoreductase [Planotetraspora kaengkrachanensis]|uniref:Probable nitronate monooxygenase n=1 Tax=Planotetraspora kaengkrachanensis TaxID=575193 RepID=A0A8J3PYU1_9ACTN|nr:nitronate monooxygenase [Planotetraspora kaengkrachanensis]GIG83629.1 oxidoreductase [Planotetraspora kaengkrachanensis]
MAGRILPFGMALPVIQSPMAGGPSTPALAATVSAAGGLGFLAAGSRTASAVRDEIAEVRARTDAPFGVNVFVPGPDPARAGFTEVEADLACYREELVAEAERYGVDLPETVPWDDDQWEAKIDLLVSERVPVVSFMFGCPSPEIVSRLHGAGSTVVVTVNTPAEAVAAAETGADALSVQGPGAGGHQADFLPSDWSPPSGLPELVAEIRGVVDLPMAAAGGLMDGRDIAAVLRAGAVAAQLGTAFLRTTESGAHPVHKAALADPAFTETAFTRAFTGRRARGLANRFMAEHEGSAPHLYPQVNRLTAGLRQAAAAQGDPHGMSLWAGVGFRRARDLPAAQVVASLAEETRAALG